MKTNHYRLVFKPPFKHDYNQLKRAHLELIDDLNHTIRQLAFSGTVGVQFKPHMLSKRGGL